jgi:hypothetical protein
VRRQAQENIHYLASNHAATYSIFLILVVFFPGGEVSDVASALDVCRLLRDLKQEAIHDTIENNANNNQKHNTSKERQS